MCSSSAPDSYRTIEGIPANSDQIAAIMECRSRFHIGGLHEDSPIVDSVKKLPDALGKCLGLILGGEMTRLGQ